MGRVVRAFAVPASAGHGACGSPRVNLLTGLLGAPSVLWLPWVAGLAVGLGVLAGGLVWRARTAERRRIQRTVRRLSQEGLRDVVIPDGIDGVLQIDCLLLTHRGVLVLDLRPYAGMLFGAEHIDYWTQITKGGSYRFPNPLHENRLRVQAVRTLLPG
ncbi:MAG TPA: NERD domain-containing protein, partial [Chromatiales bacterium]|nr:NERD domain-containing protein [Chromatiales bacterium]